MEGYTPYEEIRSYVECVFKMMDDGVIISKLLLTSPDEPDDKLYMAKYYNSKIDEREETMQRSQDG